MARMITSVFACLLFAVAVSAQIVAFTVQPPPAGTTPASGNTYVGLKTGYYFVDTSKNSNQIPRGSSTLTLYGDSALQFFVNGEPSNTLSFNPSQRSVSFQVSSNTVGTFAFGFTKTDDSDTDPAYAPAPANLTVTFEIRPIFIESLAGNNYIGEPTEPLRVSIPVASSAPITLTPSTTGLSEYIGNGTVRFIPDQITIPAGSLSVGFNLLVPSSVVVSSMVLDWDISGDDVTAGLYTQSLTGVSINFNTQLRPLQIYTSTSSVSTPGGQSSYLYVYTQQMGNSTFTLTPQAADTTFTPSSMTFGVNVQVARYQYTTTSPGTKQINWMLGGDSSYYSNPVSTTITIPKRYVYVQVASSEMVLTNKTYMEVYITGPTPNRVTVSFYGVNVRFPTASVTFDKNVTSFTVPIDPTNLGVDVVSFKITDADADWYYPIPDVSISVAGGRFVYPAAVGQPNALYVPVLYVGQTSPKIAIRASFSPRANVTITPSAPNLAFSPLQLTFRNGSEQQYFTITPLYSNSEASYTTTVNWLVSGTDHAYFIAPPALSVTVNRRSIQTAWSPHLTLTDPTRNPTSNVHLGKTYKVWTTVNYIGKGETVTVTPVSPYFSFNPKVMTFTDKKTRILLETTVTGVVGTTNIAYVIGGPQGGWYAPMSSDARFTAIRPLAIDAAVVAPDNRTPRKKAALVDYPDFKANAAAYLSSFHVYTFKLRSFVLPDNGLTITPKCAHATFSPSSITLKGHSATSIIDVKNQYSLNLQNGGQIYFNYTGLYLEANFSVNPQANGLHLVKFELSGKDAPYYNIPADASMMFREVERDSNEPQHSSAWMVVPSFAAVAVAVAALFM